jgi:hypothetical protein
VSAEDAEVVVSEEGLGHLEDVIRAALTDATTTPPESRALTRGDVERGLRMLAEARRTPSPPPALHPYLYRRCLRALGRTDGPLTVGDYYRAEAILLREASGEESS